MQKKISSFNTIKVKYYNSYNKYINKQYKKNRKMMFNMLKKLTKILNEEIGLL